MPTPESSAAFQNMVDARSRLNDVSKELQEAVRLRGSVMGDEKERALQAKWSETFKAFQQAVREFSDVVGRLDDVAEERRLFDKARRRNSE